MSVLGTRYKDNSASAFAIFKLVQVKIGHFSEYTRRKFSLVVIRCGGIFLCDNRTSMATINRCYLSLLQYFSVLFRSVQ